MKRSGTEYAELFAESFVEFRESGDALILCKYTEALPKIFDSIEYLLANLVEEIDCLISEADKSVDSERYHQADKIIGFPWCDISKDPIINGFFEEIESGNRWIVTSILSNDPIKAYTQCVCTRLYDNKPIAIAAFASAPVVVSYNPHALTDDMFWARNSTGATPYPLTDSYTPIPYSDFGPDVDQLTARAGQRVRFVYSASLQIIAIGANGGRGDFQLQRSMELDGQSEVWSDLANLTAPVELAIDQNNRYSFSFTDQISSGIASGIALKYRLTAKRDDSAHAVSIHQGSVNPTITIDADYLYQELDEIPISVSVNLIIDTTGEGFSAGSAEIENGLVVGSSPSTGFPAIPATGSSALTVSFIGDAVVADLIWVAPPSTPSSDTLDLTYEEIFGTTVTIPANSSGGVNARFVYSAALSLLATGANGGLCTFQLQKSEAGGVWADVTGETATIEFMVQDDEARTVFDLYDAYPTGIPFDTEVRYRLMGKTDTAGREVDVHASLIDPVNVAPNCSVAAEYFFG